MERDSPSGQSKAAPHPLLPYFSYVFCSGSDFMIQFFVQDTYPTYSVTFYREGILTDKIHGIAKDDLDEVVFGFNEDDKEQIFNPIGPLGFGIEQIGGRNA